MKRYNNWVWGIMLLGLVACTDEDYKMYDTTQKDSAFFQYLNVNQEEATAIDYVFNYDIATEHVVEIPVKLMGMPADHDRKIELKAVEDPVSTEEGAEEVHYMVEGTHYTVDEAVIPANAVESVVRVHLLRDKDPLLLEQAFTLNLEIQNGEDLGAVGQKRFTIVYSDIRPTRRPSWWTTYTEIPEYSFEAAQQFFKYFYELAPKANKDVFDEMIAAYGDYFVRAGSTKGPFAMYTNFLKMYVQIPMYNDLKDEFTWQAIPSM